MNDSSGIVLVLNKRLIAIMLWHNLLLIARVAVSIRHGSGSTRLNIIGLLELICLLCAILLGLCAALAV